MAGSDIMIMRHPEAIRLVKAFIDLVSDGGSAGRCGRDCQSLDDVDIDFAALAPGTGSDHRRRKRSPGQEGGRQERRKRRPCQKAAPKKAAAKKAAKKSCRKKAAAGRR
jgi:acetyl-CoA decarbonylase/synthase complex subunit delta